ncbi:hypothetical protein MMC18_006257 [Xylographa bjoerkii]|nr:hypothetical protein [Xylographa bjoerkii]
MSARLSAPMGSFHFTPQQKYPDARVYGLDWGASVPVSDPSARQPRPVLEPLSPREPPSRCLCAEPTRRTPSYQNSTFTPSSSTSGDACRTELYTLLDKGNRQIRLLRIFPSHEDDIIECECFVKSLDDDDDYYAVSYVWGSLTPPQSIILDGHRKSITPNLFALLTQFRKSKYEQFLWIDALCINQEDDVEKSWQVGMMDEIYRRSQVCLVWLGTGTDFNHVSQAFQLLKDLAEAKNTISTTSSKLLALKSLMALPWWSRIWVVQELALSRHSTFLCGSQEIEWTIICGAAQFCIGHVGHGQILWPVGCFNARIEHVGSTPCKCLDAVRRHEHGEAIEAFVRAVKKLTIIQNKMQGNKPNVGFLELLCSLRGRLASNPKDYIYALLGLLIGSEGRDRISIDYSQDTISFYVESAAKIIDADKSLRLLMLKSMHRDADPLLPSWVPDWRQTPSTFSYGRVLMEMPCGCSWFKAGRPTMSMDVAGNGELVLKGTYYDSILVVGDLWSDDSSALMQWANLVGVSYYWDKGTSIRDWLENIYKDRRDIYPNEVANVEFTIEKWRQDIQDRLPSRADGMISKIGGIISQSEEVIREQFMHVNICKNLLDYYRTLLCDTMCDETITPLQGGDARPVRRMYATDLPAVTLFIIFKVLGFSTATISKVPCLNNIQNTLNLIGIESRRFFITINGFMGLGPPESSVGDQILLLDGGSWPFLLRASLPPSTDGRKTYNDKGKAERVIGKPSRAKTTKPKPPGDGHSDPEWDKDRWSSSNDDDMAAGFPTAPSQETPISGLLWTIIWYKNAERERAWGIS